MPALPPDRGHILAEQRNQRSAALHTLPPDELIALIQEEDRTIHDAVAAARPALTGFLEALEAGFRRGGRLIYVGAGTSGRLGVLDASEIPPTFQLPPDRVIGIIAGGDVSLRRSSEGKEDDPDGASAALDELDLNGDDAVLGIAAGGTTPYVRGALGLAKVRAPSCVTGLLSCSPVEAPAGCDHLIVAPTGPEVVTGSTRMKAGTATKLLLNTLSTALMVRMGRVYGNLMVDLKASNAKLRDRAARILMATLEVDRAEAFTLLERAGDRVKTALVMHWRSCERGEAERLLSLHDDEVSAIPSKHQGE